jgi:polygalacturonase
MSGDVRNVFIENSKLGDVQSALCVKSNSDRGGTVESVWMRGNTVDACDYLIKLETDYKGVLDHQYPSAYRDLHFESLTCRTARKCGIYAVGIAGKPIWGIFLKDIKVDSVGTETNIANTRGLEMQNVSLNGRLVR